MLALASLYGLSDEQLEYQVKDRLSFMRFLGLDLQDRVLDATTIWLFREALGSKSGLLDKLFQRFERHLHKAGYEARGGQIIDASLVEVPTLRGKPDDDHELRSRQQDRDAYMDTCQRMVIRERPCKTPPVRQRESRHGQFHNHLMPAGERGALRPARRIHSPP